MATFRELRAAGQFDDAIAKLIHFCRSKDPQKSHQALRMQVFGSRCLILDWASHAIGNGRRNECSSILRDLRRHVLPCVVESTGLLECRLQLIEAMTGPDADADKIREAIQSTIKAVELAWNYRTHPGVHQAENTTLQPTLDDPLNGPAFLKHLQNPDRTGFDYDSMRRIFHELALEFGWMHPGLLLAGETLAALESGGTKSDFKTTSWIMFAAEIGGESHGVLARLTMERLPGGRGLLVPDPFASAYHQMAECFSSGLQHAWLATRVAQKLSPAYDWRWRIEVEEATRETPLATVLAPEMTGHSAEGTLACAMLTVGRGEELDRNTCMSARLRLSNSKPWLQSTLDLETVDGLDTKTLANRLRVKKIRDIIVSDLQTDIETDTGSHHNFIKVKDLSSAETHFGIWPKITRAVRAGLHREATQLRNELCGEELAKDRRRAEGRAYVPSPIALRLPAKDALLEGRLPEPEPLSSAELRDFAYGRWRPQSHDASKPLRLRLFADSGMGKTVQLIVCEQKIAGDDTLRIPIRLGRRGSLRKTGSEQSLEGIGWTGRRDEDLKQLAMVHLQAHVPKEHAGRSAEWIIRMAELGQLCFLLDALDQTRSDLEFMATFLKTVPDCSVLVAGRPESLTSRAEVFENQEWSTLELQKLDGNHQERFLGTAPSAELIPEKDEPNAWSSLEERRKHYWKDLLGFPLLISLLKRLAVRDAAGKNQLDGISNRYSLYRKAAEQLFQKGLRSIPDAKRDDIRDQAIKLMKAIAGHMVCQHNFDVVEGDELDDLRQSIDLQPQQLKDLVQLDIIKEYAFLERIELEDRTDDTVPMQRGIEWRHRSFLEFYAALSLADLWKRNSDKLRSTLRDVHESLDSNGRFRLWRVKTEGPGHVEDQFRNLSADWQWTLRFLLAHLEGTERSDVARELIGLSNPWVVFDAMDQDRIEFAADVTITARWLVHKNWLLERDWSKSLTTGLNPSSPTEEHPINVDDAVEAFQTMQQHRPSVIAELLASQSRDAGVLPALRDLLIAGSGKKDEKAVQNWTTVTAFRKSALDDYLRPERWVCGIPGYPGVAMSDFPVTNAVFEAFCASHRRFRDRDQYSSDDDQPVLYVSWWMAQEFCRWLTDVSPGRRYFLPHGTVWEAACRWNTPREWDFWWGPRMNDQLCLYGGYDSDDKRETNLGRTRSRGEAIAAFTHTKVWHPSHSDTQVGLLDMSGNVWEWCEHRRDEEDDSPGSSRVLRGGSWYRNAGHCGSGYRFDRTPVYRDGFIGFRLCME